VFVVAFVNVNQEVACAKKMKSKEPKIMVVPKMPCSIFPMWWHEMQLQLY